jgi:hypothetical protein
MKKLMNHLLGMSMIKTNSINKENNKEEFDRKSSSNKSYRILAQFDNDAPIIMFDKIHVDNDFKIVMKTPIAGSDNNYLEITDAKTGKKIKIFGQLE